MINLQQGVSLTFSLKYLLNFAKSAPLASKVSLKLTNDIPLLVSSFLVSDVERRTLILTLWPLPFSGRLHLRAGLHPLLPCVRDLCFLRLEPLQTLTLRASACLLCSPKIGDE